MGMTLGDILVNVKSDTSELRKDFKRAESTVSKASKNMTNAIKTITAAYIGLNAIDLVGNLVKQADTMTLINTRLKLATKSTEELVKAQEDLFKISQEARTGYASSVDLFERITRSTRDYATSQKEILGLTETINKSMVISGGTAESMNAAIIQLGQAFSADFQAVGQELGSIREQAPRLYQALLEGTNMSSKAFKKAAEDGELSTQIIIEALKSQSEAVDTEFKKVNLSVSQSNTVLKNSALRLIGELDKISGISKSVAESISSVAKSIEEVKPENIEETARQIKAVTIAIVATTVAIKGYKTATALAVTANTLLGGSFGAVNRAILLTTVSTKALSLAIKTIPIVTVVGLIAGLADAWMEANKAHKEYNKTADESAKKDTAKTNRARVAQLEKLIETGRFNEKTVNNWRKAIERLNAEYDKLTKKKLDSVTGTPASEVGGEKGPKFDAHVVAYKEYIKERNELEKKNIDIAANNFIAGFSNTRTEKEFEQFVKDRNKFWAEEIKDDKAGISDELAVNIAGGLTGAIKTGLEGRSLINFASGLGAQMGNAMAQQAITQMLQAQTLSAAGGLDLAVGVGVMAISSLLSRDSGGESQADIAQEEFNTFIDSLKKAEEALFNFGNEGTAIATTISELQTKITQDELSIATKQEKIVTLSSLMEGFKEGGFTRWKRNKIDDINEDIGDLNREIDKLNIKIADTIKEDLASAIDYSRLSIGQLESETGISDVSAFNQSLKEAQDTYMNTALEIKKLQITGEDFEGQIDGLALSIASMIDESTDILNVYSDNQEAIDLLNKKRTDGLKEEKTRLEDLMSVQTEYTSLINREMLGTLSYLTDTEKLAYANNLYRTAITPEDRIASSRAIAEVSRRTSATREDYIVDFNRYINEIEKQAEEATTLDVVNKLDQVIDAINNQTESATNDAIYAGA